MRLAKQDILSTKGSLAAVIHYPEKETDKLAILCPGYLDSKDYKHLIGLAEELGNRGYVVVRFDPTGTWESAGDIFDYTTSQYLEDVKNVLVYMLGQASYKHILLGGHSRGGQVSILYTARDPKITAVLGIMPSHGPLSFQREEWERAGARISPRDLPDGETGQREFHVPFRHVLDHDQYDALADVCRIRVPLVLVAGALDDVVPPEDVRELFENANEPKRFVLIEGVGHDYRHHDEQVKLVNERIMEVLHPFL